MRRIISCVRRERTSEKRGESSRRAVGGCVGLPTLLVDVGLIVLPSSSFRISFLVVLNFLDNKNGNTFMLIMIL